MNNNQDIIPQRPFRRLSGSSSGNQRLLAVPEDDANQEEAVPRCPCPSIKRHSQSSKDTPPTKPYAASTVCEESTFGMMTEEDMDGSTRGRATTACHAEMDDSVRAREQPNTKAPTVPIDPDNRILMKRKELIEELWRCFDERNLEGLRQVCTPDFTVVFRGSRGEMTMGLEEIIHGSSAVFDALPDFRFMYRAIQESQQSPGVLVLQDFVGTGRHTGKPLALGPLPPIEPKGTLVVLDECEQHYHFDPITGKICREEEFAMGETTGIFGIYTLLSRQ